MKAKGEAGSVVVEFALILPIFLLLIFSLIDFGRYFYTRVMITNASIEVASAVSRGLYLETDSSAMKMQRINNVLENVAPNIAALAQLQSGATLTVIAPAACPNTMNQTSVTLSTPFDSISPIADFLEEVRSQTTMRCLR